MNSAPCFDVVLVFFGWSARCVLPAGFSLFHYWSVPVWPGARAGGLMGKAHLWRSAQSAPSLRAGGGCSLSVKRIKAVTSCPVCVTEKAFYTTSWSNFLNGAVTTYDQTLLLFMIYMISRPLSSASQETLRASWTSFPVPLMRLQHRYSTGVQNEEGHNSQSVWRQRQIVPGMSKHLSAPNSTQLLACCSFVVLAGRSSTFVEYLYQSQSMSNPSPKYESCGKGRHKPPVNRRHRQACHH